MTKQSKKYDRPKTGWPPGLLQDDCRKLSMWFAGRLDAKRIARQVCKEIAETIKKERT